MKLKTVMVFIILIHDTSVFSDRVPKAVQTVLFGTFDMVLFLTFNQTRCLHAMG